MAMRVQNNPLEAAYAVLLENGLDVASEALRILVNEAAGIERSAFLGAKPHERTETRHGYANGFKPLSACDLPAHSLSARAPAYRVAGRRPASTRDSKPGASVPWGKRLTSSWMPVTRRCAWREESSIARC